MLETIHKIKRIQFLLTRSQLFGLDDHTEEIQAILLEVFSELTSADHDTGKRIRVGLLDCSEQFHNPFFMHLFLLLEHQLRSLREIPVVETPEDFDDVDQEYPTELFYDVFRFVLENNKSIKLFSVKLPPIEVSRDLLRRLLTLLIDVVQHDIVKLRLDREDIRHVIILLAIVRGISSSLQQLHIFYELTGVVVEALNVSEEYQLCRDLGEEIFATSIIDGQVEWGCFVLFKTFNGQLNINVSFIYANACLASLNKRSRIPERILKLFFFSLQRLYRNSGFKDEEARLYKSLLTNSSLNAFERFDFINTHLMTLISERDAAAVPALCEYLRNNRAFVIQRKDVALPLLNTAYHITQVFQDESGIEEVGPYLTALESTVGSTDVDLLRALVRGDPTNLKEIYINQLSALDQTLSAEDFVSEVRRPLITADHLIKLGFDHQDVDAFLLGMILKSDRTWVFEERSPPHSRNLAETISSGNETNSARLRNYASYLRKELAVRKGQACLWLTARGDDVYYLALTSFGFSDIIALPSWKMSEMQAWLARGFSDLAFDDKVKKGNQIEPYIEGDQLQDLIRIKNALIFAQLVEPKGHELFVIKDMGMSSMPHNLILGLSKDFISQERRITSLPSAEWLIATRKARPHLRKDFTVELWIPTGGGDLTLNLLWSKMCDPIKTFDIKISTHEVPKKPLSADLNILSAHGAADISAFPSLFTRDKVSIINIERIVGSGSVVILFVCHSGSAEKDIFRQKLLSLVRMFIGNGYQAVIAPFWAMHITIPPIWLPEFLGAIRNGVTIAEAAFLANRRVYQENKNPGAWACMHLYGNPDLRAQ